MQQVGVRELREQTTEILRNVHESQAEYIVTRNGEPMALLLPITARSFVKENRVAQEEIYSRQALAKKIEQTLGENKELSPNNRQMLQIYQDWLNELGEEEDDEWWEELDAFLEKHRFRLRSEAL